MAHIPIDAPHEPALEILSHRELAWPREQVWAAYEQPERLARWWGPAGFSNRFASFDFRVGGDWHFTMHGPDGKDYANQVRFLVLESPARLVLEHVNAPHFVAHVELASAAGGAHTLLQFRMRFETAALRDAVAVYAVPANEQNFDRLQVELARPSRKDAR